MKIGILIALVGVVLLTASAALAQAVTDYRSLFQVTVTNETGSPFCNRAVAAPINTANLVSGAYIAPSGVDMLTVLQSSGVERKIAAQMDGNPSTWWYPVTGCLAVNGSTSFLTYVGGATTAADNTQAMWLEASSTTPDSITIPHSASLSIDGPFVLESLNTDLQVMPGTEVILVGKEDSYELGVRDGGTLFVKVTGSSSIVEATAAIDAGIYDLKTIYNGTTLDLFVDDVAVASASAIPAVTLVQQASGTGTSATFSSSATSGNLLIALVRRDASLTVAVPSGFSTARTQIGTNVAVAIFYKVANGSETTITSSGSNAIQIFEYANLANTLDVVQGGATTGASSQSTGSTSTTSLANSLVVAIVGLATDRTFSAWTNDFATLIPQTRSFTGSKVTAITGAQETTASWSGGTSNAAAAIAAFPGLSPVVPAANSNPVVIGRGEITTSIGRTYIENNGTPVLDFTYQPATVEQTQEGNSGNGWQWLGTVADQSGAGNDGAYAFYRDMTGLTVTVGALQAVAQSIAVPVGEDFPTFGVPDPSCPFGAICFVVGDWRPPFNAIADTIVTISPELDYLLKMVAVVAFAVAGGLLGLAASQGMYGIALLGITGGAGAGAWFSGIEPIVMIITGVVCLALIAKAPRAFEGRG